MKKYWNKYFSFIVLLFIVPITASFILGYEMDNDRIDVIPTIIIDHDNSEFSRYLIEYIDDNDYFEVVKYGSSNEEIEDALINGEAMMGLVIPKGLFQDMVKGDAPKVLAFYDGTMLPVVSSAKSIMAEIFLTLKSSYLLEVYEGELGVVSNKALEAISPLDVEYKTLFNPVRSYRYFLLPGMLMAVLQVSLSLIGVSLFWQKRKNWLSILRGWFFWSFMGVVAVALCLGIQYFFFNLPFRGSLAFGIILTFIFALCKIVFGYLFGTIVSDELFSYQITSLIVIPTSILGGYTFPLLAMPEIFNPFGNLIPFTHYGEAIRNLCLKEVGFSSLKIDLEIILIFLLVELLALLVINFGLKLWEKLNVKANHEKFNN